MGRMRTRLRALGRLYRQKWRKTRSRLYAQVRILIFKVLIRIQIRLCIVLHRGERWIATSLSIIAAMLFAFTVPETLLSTTGGVKSTEVHLASAGIIGPALALVLSLSIVPAQKAADVFSAAILKLYARDRTTLWVFSLLSCTALLSLLLGTGWNFGLSARYMLPAEFILIGISLDALRAFYMRALDLLVPATALAMVSRECDRHTRGTRKQIERILRAHQFTNDDPDGVRGVRYLAYKESKSAGRANRLVNAAGRIRAQGGVPQGYAGRECHHEHHGDHRQKLCGIPPRQRGFGTRFFRRFPQRRKRHLPRARSNL